MTARFAFATSMGPLACAALALAAPRLAHATTPCGDFDECKVLVEINATDGDIGFHWLVDGEDLVTVRIDDPRGTKIFENRASAELFQQYFTETFGESSEPKCRARLAEPGEDIVTLRQFARRWPRGSYAISGRTDEGEALAGRTSLTFWLPAAPAHVAYSAGVVTWQPGASLGVCATESELWDLVEAGVLPVHPMNVPVRDWEVTVELEDGSHREFSLRLPARGSHAQTSVTLPAEFLQSVAPDTPAKLEVGAIGGRLEAGDDDNGTFTELLSLCLNRRNGCPASGD